MAVGLLAGVAAGVAQGMRQKRQDSEMKAYRESMADLNKARAERLRRGEPLPKGTNITPGTSFPESGTEVAQTAMPDTDEVEYARGGMVGYNRSPGVMSPASHSWQKQSFKK